MCLLIVPEMFTSEIRKATGASGITGSGRNRQTWTAPPAAGTCLLKDPQPQITAATEYLHSPEIPVIGRDIRNRQRDRNSNGTTVHASRVRNVRRIFNAREARDGADK